MTTPAGQLAALDARVEDALDEENTGPEGNRAWYISQRALDAQSIARARAGRRAS